MKKKNDTEIIKIENNKTQNINSVDNSKGFSNSLNDAFRQKNEKGFFTAIIVSVFIIVILLVGALSNILNLCFQVNRWFGYAMVGVTALLIIIFIIVPTVKLLSSRFFITDVTSVDVNVAKKKNYKALREVSKSLVVYNLDEKNSKYKYIKDENIELLKQALSSGDKNNLKSVLKDVYGTDVANCVNSLIWKSAGKVFLTTSISQNDKIDAISVLLVNLSMVKQIVGIYGYRPSYAKLFKIYLTVLSNSLLAYGMQNVNWFNVFGKFFTGIAKKIPFLDTIVDSAVQGTVSAFMTVLVGYKTKKYLCSDYKKVEKIDMNMDDAVSSTDDEVRIASAWAKEIQLKNKDKIKVEK